MRGLFVLFILLTFSYCNDGTSNNLSQPGPADFKISDNKDIFSSWVMCSSFSIGIMTQMNTCPIITFTNNGAGFITSNSLITESFKWRLEKKNMRIIYSKQYINTTFPDTNYYAEFSKQEDVINLVLRHKRNEYYLSRFAK